MHLGTCGCACHRTHVEVRGLGNWFFPATKWVPGTKLRQAPSPSESYQWPRVSVLKCTGFCNNPSVLLSMAPKHLSYLSDYQHNVPGSNKSHQSQACSPHTHNQSFNFPAASQTPYQRNLVCGFPTQAKTWGSVQWWWSLTLQQTTNKQNNNQHRERQEVHRTKEYRG